MERIGMPEILIFLVVILVIFFLIREVICWYYKINKRVELQTETVRLLKKLVELNTPQIPTEISSITLSGQETSVNDPAVMKKIISDLDKN